MSNPKKLHPIAALLTFFKELKSLILPVVFVIFIGNGERNSFWDYFPIVAIGMVVLYVLISGIVKWLRFTYRLEENEFKIEYGLFVKKKRYIPIERIQSLNVSEGLLHRMFGLVKITVETAGAGAESESEAELTAITKEEAQALQQLINQEKKRKAPVDVTDDLLEKVKTNGEEDVIYQAQLSELLLLAATSGGIGVVVSAVFAFLSQFQDIIPYEKIFKEASHFIEMGTVFIAFIVFLALFAAWIISIGMTLLRYAGFTLCHKEESLIIRRGLLEKQQLTVPMDRIQGITILENPLRQGLGYCSVHLESAGGTAKEKDNANMVVMPMVKKEQALKMLAEIFPDYCFSVKLTPAPAQAISRYMGRACLYLALPVALATWFFWPFGLAFLAVFLPAALYGFICFKAVGWNIQGNQFTVRTRRVSLQTAFMMKNRIQSLEMINTWRQRRKKLSSIHSVIRSGIGGKKIKLIDASAVDGEKIYQWYELRKKG